ncbi:hypothetical protein BCR34DRAFT_583669 [Clohesyomyces aquaticus]|uniref:Uncharacterized protein n=1 Tax=Clohesyomyces aquaticus TaxID=1231657 RepID=A0A1Y2A659_9PLEO|nr:hypothetical protein BCR34DRAFT_583669 [Clohesyomyces aquaticus]
MHTLSLRSFLLLCAFAFACLQALTIPEQHRSSLSLRDLKLENSVEPLDLDRRAKKPPTKPPPPPPPPPKSNPPPPPPPPTSKAAPPPPPPSSAPPPPPPPASSNPPPPPPASSNPPPPSSSSPPKGSPSSALSATPASSIVPSTSNLVPSTSISGSTLSSAVSSSSSSVSSGSLSSSASSISLSSSVSSDASSSSPSVAPSSSSLSSDPLSPSASTVLSTVSGSLTSPSQSAASSSFDSSLSASAISGSPTASGSVSLSSVSSSVQSSVSASAISGSITSSASISDSTSLSSTSTISSSSSVVIDYVHPTTAVNTCDLLGVDCYEDWDEFDGVFDDSDDTNSTAPFANNTRRALTKRGDRDFKATIPPVGTLPFQSLGYPGPKALFTGRNGAGVSAHSFSFKSNDLDDFSIEDFNNPSNPGDYVVEHIIELQSIKLFIEAAVGNPGSIKLSKTVPAQFFQDWWTVTLDENDVATRSQPKITQAKFSDKERTLNNLIFQSLGSSFNRADFVLCQPEINSYKKSVWIGESPMGDKRFQAYADDVAIGGADERDHLSALRTTLAVYSYLNHAEVKSRLQSAVANVETELSNVKHLTKEDHDLAGLWIEFMSALLLRTEKNGRDWLTKSITYSNNAYQKELDNLLALQKKLKPDSQLTQAEKLARDKKVDALTKERTTLDQAARKADRDVEDSEKRLHGYTSDVAAARAKKDTAAENAAKTKREAEKKVLEQAKTAKYEADKKVNLKNREMHVLYRQVLDKIIDAIKKDMKTLDGYSAATKKISMPSAT